MPPPLTSLRTNVYRGAAPLANEGTSRALVLRRTMYRTRVGARENYPTTAHEQAGPPPLRIDLPTYICEHLIDDETENVEGWLGMNWRTARIAFLLSLAICTSVTAAETETVSMSFEGCLANIRHIASQFGIAPVNIVETNILRIVRFPTGDGSILVSCSSPDNKMVVTKSSKRCGVDVNC